MGTKVYTYRVLNFTIDIIIAELGGSNALSTMSLLDLEIWKASMNPFLVFL